MRKITTILLTCGVVCAVVAIAVPLAILASEGAYTKITLAVLDKDSADRYITNGGMEDPNADPLPTPTFNSGSKWVKGNDANDNQIAFSGLDNGGFVGQRFSSVPSSPFQPTYLPDISPVLTVSRSAIISKAKCYYYNAKVVYDDGTDRYETYALVAMLSKENEEHSNNWTYTFGSVQHVGEAIQMSSNVMSKYGFGSVVRDGNQYIYAW